MTQNRVVKSRRTLWLFSRRYAVLCWMVVLLSWCRIASSSAFSLSTTTPSVTQLQLSSSTSSSSTAAETTGATTTTTTVVPKLIVFDLDHTLWTPELYRLRKLQRQQQQPIAHKDVTLFPAIQKILTQLQQQQQQPNHTSEQFANTKFANTKFAIASRTKSVAWAHNLVQQFGLESFFEYIEIFPGDKKQHFQKLHEASGIAYRDMVFFDDARDGRYGNCVPVSYLGVLCVHCPRGLNDVGIWEQALQHYQDWSVQHNKVSNSIVEWDGTLTLSGIPSPQFQPIPHTTPPVKKIDPSTRWTGTLKFVNTSKRYGFIQYGPRNTKDLFFHFNTVPDTVDIQKDLVKGTEVSFTVSHDRRKGKDEAKNMELVIPTQKRNANDYEHDDDDDENDKSVIEMHVFSMNLPFAALLSNGYKTLETRNGTMFVPYPEGTKMLLHVGQRNYPDGNRHLDVMKSGGLSDTEITELKSFPNKNYGKGMVVAIVELGRTYETTLEERCDPNFQRAVGAFGEDSGMRATEIKRVEYLNTSSDGTQGGGIKVSGQGGVFKIKIQKDAIPPGWL